MKRLVLFALFGFGSLHPLAGVAQNTASGDAFIESRQAEVTQLGSMIYRTHFDDGTWTHRQVAVCPAFTHHVFAHYDHQNSNGTAGEGMTFLAVYSLDSTPAPSADEPWKGGVILVPLPAVHDGEAAKVTAERPETMTLFNRIWKDELRRSGTPNAFPQLTWQGLAECYARLANEQTLPAQKISNDTTIDFRHLPVHSLLVPVQGTADHQRWLYLRIDRQGEVVESTVKNSIRPPEVAAAAAPPAATPSVATSPNPPAPNSSLKPVHGRAAKKRLPVDTVAGTVDSSTLPGRTVPGTVDANSLPGRVVAGTVDENGLPVLPASGVKH